MSDFSFWNQSGIATQVPASWMAAWADYVEIGTNAYAASFHSAGGKYALAYINANYWFTSPTYTAPGSYAESAFGHTGGGARVSRPQGGGTEYYLNPNSAASQTGYAGIVSAVKGGGGYNYIYADGVSSNLSISLYHFSGTPVEITTDAQYVGGMKQTIAGGSMPAFVNGYMNGNPIQEEEYVGATNVAGMFGESCFTTYGGSYTGQPWTDMANALLYTTSHHVPAICGGRGALADNRPLRIYWLASWWLTYDQNYSIALEIMGSDSNPVYVFPEEMIVPENPLQTATSIASLQVAGGAYARQFGNCYHDRNWWGACAAIVNPSATATVTMPALAASYHHSLALDLENLYAGGQASLSPSVPASLGPGQAVILFP